MSFNQFPHAPQPLLPMQHARTPSTESMAMPVHPLLRPLPSSRLPDETYHESGSPNGKDEYRNNLHQLLNSERWAHHRTMHSLRQECARRAQLEQQIGNIRSECQGMANGWAVSARNLMMCESERLELIRQLNIVRSELESCQAALHESIEKVKYHTYSECSMLT